MGCRGRGHHSCHCYPAERRRWSSLHCTSGRRVAEEARLGPGARMATSRAGGPGASVTTPKTLALLLASLLLLDPALAGNCWSAMVRSGRCTDLLSEKVTKEECCASHNVATAWSPEDMDAESCAGVHCGEGKKCVVRKGRPKCVCSPSCRGSGGGGGGGGGGGRRRQRSPVCGTDGRDYASACRLRKHACRNRSSTLAVAYYGRCQSSCDRIRCQAGKHCLLDQNLTPHCVKCAQRCAAPAAASKAVCGADGVTYQSACHLREAACLKGKAIPVAYKGRCKHAASCETVQCRDRQSCLVDMQTRAPRCVTCNYRCPRAEARRRGLGGPICGSDDRTYPSWCHMLSDACSTGYVIETKHPGACGAAGTKPAVTNTVRDDPASMKKYS